MDKILCFSNCKSLDSSTVRQSSHPILQHDTPIRCSSVQHRDLQRDDNNRFQRFHPKFAIDGNAENCWAGGFDGLQECWIEVVLPEKHVITSMSVTYSCAGKLALQALLNGIWITAKVITTPAQFEKKDDWISTELPTFIRPVQRCRLIQIERHSSENGDDGVRVKQDYNLFNCGMLVRTFQMEGYPYPEVTHNDKIERVPRVFFSYNWSHQDLVSELAFEVEKELDIPVWQDVGQMVSLSFCLLQFHKTSFQLALFP
jgi:hypothetical protein